MLTAFFSGGIRCSELTGLRVCDVMQSSKGTWYLRVRKPKGGGQRDQPVQEWAVPEILRLRDQRMSEGRQEDYLFCGYGVERLATGKPMNRKSVYRRFVKYIREAMDEGVYSPHSARATSITKLLSDGLDYRQVQEFAGHKSVQMVEIYDKRTFGVDKNPGLKLKWE